MAYAQVAGLPAVTGLWAALGPLLVYFLLGSSRLLSMGPESTTALMTAAAIGPLAAGDPTRYAMLAAVLALLVGGVYLVAWLARLGFLADLLSKPVLVGYMAGIAVIMVTGQLGRLTGVKVSGDSSLEEIASVARQIGAWHPPTVALSVAVLGLLLVAARWLPRLPGPLIVVVLASVLVWATGLDVKLVGAVPSGIPVPELPQPAAGDLRLLLLPALGVALVGYTDTVLTGRAFALRHRERINPDRGLLATVVDRDNVHLYQPGLLFLPFGQHRLEHLRKPRRRLLRPGIRLELATDMIGRVRSERSSDDPHRRGDHDRCADRRGVRHGRR